MARRTDASVALKQDPQNRARNDEIYLDIEVGLCSPFSEYLSEHVNVISLIAKKHILVKKIYVITSFEKSYINKMPQKKILNRKDLKHVYHGSRKASTYIPYNNYTTDSSIFTYRVSI